MGWMRLRGSRVCVALLMLGGIVLAGCPPQGGDEAKEDVANEWMTLFREASLFYGEKPTVEARLFYHFSLAMYEAWAAYDDVATGILTGDSLKQPVAARTLENRAEAISHAAYAFAKQKYASMAAQAVGTPARAAYDALTAKMIADGYLDAAGNVVTSDAQRLGAEVAALVYAAGIDDGANEGNNYDDFIGYLPVNPPIPGAFPGTNNVLDPNRWQPITLPNGTTQGYLTPHWGWVDTFAFGPDDPNALRYDPGMPPQVGTETEQEYIDEMVELLWVSHSLDPLHGEGAAPINLSPRVRGLETPGVYEATGHAVNPSSGLPYGDNFVPMGDYLRALAMFVDGGAHHTPPPWWCEVATDLLRGEGMFSQIPANKPDRYDLAYDVKLYLVLTAAVHDAAIGVWDVKWAYDSCRPMTGIRYLAEAGMLPVEPGFIEIIGGGDPLAGNGGEHVGKYKVKCWAGPALGVQWMLASEWKGYQKPDFLCPPFPGYPSGHTGMSRAAAEVFTAMTGDAYVPGGLAELTFTKHRFEEEMFSPVRLQWATWQDMADEAAFARLCSGVHTASDLRGAKPIGKIAGERAVAKALGYFEGTRTP